MTMDNIALTAIFGGVPECFLDVDLSGGEKTPQHRGALAWRLALKTVTNLDLALEKDVDPGARVEARAAQMRTATDKARASMKDIESRRAILAEVFDKAKASFKPAIENDQHTSVALWDRLPVDDSIAMLTACGDAIERQDWVTVNAIFAMPPTVFKGALDPETLAEMHKRRMLVEAPDVVKAIDVAKTHLDEVDSALGAATGYVEAHEKSIPFVPEPEQKKADDPVREIAAGTLTLE